MTKYTIASPEMPIFDGAYCRKRFDDFGMKMEYLIHGDETDFVYHVSNIEREYHRIIYLNYYCNGVDIGINLLNVYESLTILCSMLTIRAIKNVGIATAIWNEKSAIRSLLTKKGIFLKDISTGIYATVSPFE